MAAVAIVAYYYLYKHGELGNPTDMANEALKDAKDTKKVNVQWGPRITPNSPFGILLSITH